MVFADNHAAFLNELVKREKATPEEKKKLLQEMFFEQKANDGADAVARNKYSLQKNLIRPASPNIQSSSTSQPAGTPIPVDSNLPDEMSFP